MYPMTPLDISHGCMRCTFDAYLLYSDIHISLLCLANTSRPSGSPSPPHVTSETPGMYGMWQTLAGVEQRFTYARTQRMSPFAESVHMEHLATQLSRTILQEIRQVESPDDTGVRSVAWAVHQLSVCRGSPSDFPSLAELDSHRVRLTTAPGIIHRLLTGPDGTISLPVDDSPRRTSGPRPFQSQTVNRSWRLCTLGVVGSDDREDSLLAWCHTKAASATFDAPTS